MCRKLFLEHDRDTLHIACSAGLACDRAVAFTDERSVPLRVMRAAVHRVAA